METKFYLCPLCGNVIVKLSDSGVVPVCCGKEMTLLTPNMTDGAGEKHLPVVTCVDECTVEVKVGSIPHPMTVPHHIKFICLETRNGLQVRQLDPLAPALARFCIACDGLVAAYAYCNLHGLWKTESPIAPNGCGE